MFGGGKKNEFVIAGIVDDKITCAIIGDRRARKNKKRNSMRSEVTELYTGYEKNSRALQKFTQPRFSVYSSH